MARLTRAALLRALAEPPAAFFAWTFGVLLLLNGFFALAYLALGDGALRGGDVLGISDPFLRALAFSVGVFTTTRRLARARVRTARLLIGGT